MTDFIGQAPAQFWAGLGIAFAVSLLLFLVFAMHWRSAKYQYRRQMLLAGPDAAEEKDFLETRLIRLCGIVEGYTNLHAYQAEKNESWQDDSTKTIPNLDTRGVLDHCRGEIDAILARLKQINRATAAQPVLKVVRFEK